MAGPAKVASGSDGDNNHRYAFKECQVLSFSHPRRHLMRSYYLYSHFTVEETEAQSDESLTHRPELPSFSVKLGFFQAA